MENLTKVHITRVYTTNKDKQGNPLMGSKGAYTRLSIQTQEHGATWISGFQNQSNANWKEGDEVEIIIKQNGQYLNFETPKKDDKLMIEISKGLNKLGVIESKINAIWDVLKKQYGAVETPSDYPNEDITPDDIPF